MADANLPPERDVKDFKFQQLCKVRVTDQPAALPKHRASLIAASSKYGLTFLAVEKGFKVFRTADFVAYDQRHASDRLKHIITDLPVQADVNVGYEVTHINLSADELTLAVAITRPEHAVVYLYDVRNFATQVSGTVSAFYMIVGEGDQPVNDLSWNPVDPNLLIICYSTGRLDICNEKTRKASLSSAKAKCVCWSPKGKQLVVGRADGLLIQYDPDLNEKRKWDCPTILPGPSEALDLVWLSTYSFLVAYIPHGADSSEQPSVVLIIGSKDGPVTYDSFEDICFGSGEERKRKYYFNFIQKWEMIVAGSSNAAEIGIVGKHLDNKQAWERWNLDDSSRAECPLTDSYGDTYPMGVTVDYSSQHPIPLGEDKMHPASPILLILTTEGLVIPYHMMYMHTSAPVVTAPLQPLNTAGLRKAEDVPAMSGSQQGIVKNLFGATTTQPTSRPSVASQGFAFSAANLAGSTSKSGAPTVPSLTGFGGVPASADTGAIPKFGSTAQPIGGFPLTGSGVPASSTKSDQSDTKPPLPAGFGTTSFTGTSNKSGTSTGLPFAQTFGAPASAEGSFVFQATQGAGGFAAKTEVATDAVPADKQASSTPGYNFSTKLPDSASLISGFAFGSKVTESDPAKVPEASSQTTGFGLAAKGTNAGAATFNVKPTSTGQAQTPVFGQTSATTTPGFGQSFQKTAADTTTTTTALPPFGKAPGVSTTGVSGFGSGVGVSKQLPAVGVPVSGFTGQSSAFTGMPSAAAGKLSQSDNQSAGDFVPKSPTGPPPAVTVTRAQSPQYAPPPQYPGEAHVGGGQQELGETTEAVDQQFSKSILDEIEHFNMELSEFRYKASQTKYIVGSKDDMKRLKQQTQEMETFCTDIKATVQEQHKEVHDEKALCLDMFSMVEECRMRQHMSTDPKYLHLQKSRALDPGSADKLQQLQLQYQVLDQGLRDVDLILDTQWEDYQSRKKNRTNRVQNPTNDAVYRVVKSNHNLILAQKTKLKELEERLKQLKLYNKTSAWNNTSIGFTSNDTTTELSNLADTLLSVSPIKSKSDSSMKEEKTVNRNRLDKLREHLCRRNVSIIRSTKPGNLSVLKIPDRQLETSVFRNSQQQRTELSGAQRNSQQQMTELSGAQRNAGDFVAMFRRNTPTPISGIPTDNRTQAERQTVRMQTERNKQEQVKEKSDKDGKLTGFFQQIIEKGTEKVGKIFPPKSQTKPVATTGQGVSTKPPSQQVAIPKTVLPAFQGAQSQQTIEVVNVKEINGIKFEDITPSGSENDIETEEDDEYDEDSSGSNGEEGFGTQYNMPPTTVDSTPVTVKATSKASTQDTSTPVGRKLFTEEETKPAATFNFGAGDAGSSFKFGADTADTKTKPASASKPFMFTPPVTATATFGNQSESSKPQTGFNFSMTGTPSFGAKTETQFSSTKDDKPEKKSDEGKATTGQITGLFGKGKPPTAETGTPTITSETPASKPLQSSVPVTSLGLLSHPKSASAPAFTMFGQSVSTSAGQQSIFGQPSGSGPSVFGQASSTTPSLAGTTNDAREATQTDSAKPSGDLQSQEATREASGSDKGGTTLASDGQPSSSTAMTAATTASGIFGQQASTITTTTTTNTGGLFGQAASATAGSGLFGKPVNAATSVAATSSNLFGQAPGAGNFCQTTATSGGGLFGQATATTGTSLFGQASTTTGTSQFGQATTTGTSLFGQASSTTTTAGTSQFGQATTTGTSLFGQTTTTAATGLFGQNSSVSGASTFGQTTSATSSSSGEGIFGQKPSTTASTGLFGQPTSSASSGGLFGQTPSCGGLFGQSTTSSSGGVFGQPGGSLFGQSSTSGSGGFFGTPSSSASGGFFGQSQTTTSGGLFGQTSTPSSGGLFGQTSTSSSGGLFGQTSTSGTGGLFGNSGGSGFGTTTSGSGFGFGQSSSTGFGKSTFGQSPGFGQTPSSGSPFGQSSTDSGSGGLFSGLGGKPSAEKANTNVFGTGQPFGSTQSNTQGLFGSGTSQTFGSGTSTGGGFSSGGTFSSGTGVAATGFGAAKQQSGTGFGAAPSFGSGPSFGGTPGFGSAPGFGNPPAFGSGTSPGGFGSAPTFGSPGAATFGSVSQGGESGGFGGFASSGSPTFGALAQSNDTPTFGALSQSPNTGGFGGNTGGGFGSSPSFTGYRG